MQILIKAQLVRSLTGLFPGMANFLSPARVSPEAVGANVSKGTSVSYFGQSHTGYAGAGYMGHRVLPSYMNGTGPRLHNGLRPDEFNAVLQKGEKVLPKGSDTIVNIINKTSQPMGASSVDTTAAKDFIIDVVLEDLSGYGSGRLRKFSGKKGLGSK